MESQAAVSKGTNEGVAEVSDHGASEHKIDTAAAAGIADYLRNYTPHEIDSRQDVLQGRFRVDLASPLPEFDSQTARAYAASDLSEPTRTLFAQVCQPGTSQRHRVIQALKGVNHPYITQLVAAGVVEMSKPGEERFVIFFVRPPGKKLSEVLAQQRGYINQHLLCERIIAPIASAINQFDELALSHGLINPDTIYFAEHAVLGPCVSEPCGFSQPIYYEPVERLEALPNGKGEGSASHDFYALAALTLYIIHGPQYFAEYTRESLIRALLREGVYNAMIRHVEVPEIFYDFFRGVFCQDPEDRWDWRHVKSWLDGKRFNMLPPPAPAEAIRPFEIDDMHALTRGELAHTLSQDWKKSLEPITSGKVTQWVTVSLRSKEIAEALTRASRAINEIGSRNELQVLEQMMRLMLTLDPAGPIRIQNLAFHLDGIDTLVADFYNSKAHQELQLLAKFIEFNMGSYWLDQRRKSTDYVMPPVINAMSIKLDRLRATIRNSGLGFGLERMLYDLNPEMPCLSPLFKGMYVTTLPALLQHLDKLAPSLAKNEDPIDRHIAAFVASKLAISHEIRLHELAATPALASHRALLSLHLMAMAQQKVTNLQLPGLTHWLALRILPVLDTIHSRSLRQRLKALLVEQAQAGYAPLLADVFINTDYASADQSGFNQAWRMYQQNEAQIDSYRKGTLIEERSARVGHTIAKFIGYGALLISAMAAMKVS